MLRRWLPAGSVLAAAAALLLLLPETSSAQYRGRGFGANVGGVGFYYGSGSPYYSGFYPGYYSGSSGWNSPYYGSSWSPRSYGYYGGYSPWSTRGGYGPSYSSGWSTPSSYSYSYPPASTAWDATGRMPTAEGYYGTQTADRAGPMDRNVVIDVRVRPDAEIWFAGARTQQTGMFREFVSPALERGHDYVYQVRAHWMENGKPMELTRELRVRAGDHLRIDFLAEAAGQRSSFSLEQPQRETTPSTSDPNRDRTPRYGSEQPGPATDRIDEQRSKDRTLDRQGPGTGTTPTPKEDR